MDTIILTKKQAVEFYGSEDCKNHFAKYGKFTNDDIQKSLIKEMRRYYCFVNVVKPQKGRGYVYELSGKKNEVTPKEDGRIKNGAWSTPYTKKLDIMVVSVLEQGLLEQTAQTLSKWAVDFGAITPPMYDLLQSRYSEYLRSQHLQDLKENKIIFEGEDRIIDDFTYIIKEIASQLAGTLNRMKKVGIIEYYPVYKGHVEETDKKINLHEDTVKQIITLKRTLMEKYDVNDWYLVQFRNSPKTKAFNQDWNERLSQVTDENGEVLGLDYYYVAYAIVLKARKKKIIRYLESYNEEVIERFKQGEETFLTENETTYHKERLEFVVKKAQDIENEFLSKKIKIIPLDENLKEIYGTETLTKTVYNERENFIFDEDYYALYFDRVYTERIKKLQVHYGYTFK